jgi:hypothetical protein
LRFFLFALGILLVSVVPSHAAGPAAETVIRDLKNTKIIRSQEQPHNILNEACLACHPKDKFEFWLLIYTGKPPVVSVVGGDEKERAAAGAAVGAGQPTPKNRYNSHDALTCNFCHFGTPTAAAPKFIVEIRDLCRLCHPGTALHHLPEKGDRQRVEEAIAAAKLPGAEGKFLCTTCHKIHDSTYGMREAYTQILWQDKVPNPHGDRRLCSSCHPGRMKEGGEVRFTADGDFIRLCNECHMRPGVPASPHVVDVGSADGTWRMEYLGYPLAEGKLTCVTCHDEVSHREPDRANPKFLRGGPYDDPEKFCYRCHLEDREGQNNPHSQVDPFGRIREKSCLFCHRNKPDAGTPGGANLEMTGDESVLCANCHAPRPHPGVDHNIPLPPAMVKRKREYEESHKVTIPIAEGGMVKCSTCHNPHAKGVLKGEAGVGAGSKWRVPDFREVCAPCHGRY